MTMIYKISLIGCLSLSALLVGCQSLNTDLGSVNTGLSHLTGDNVSSASSAPPASSQPTGTAHISNSWHVTDAQAMAWLSHDQITWNDNGKLNNVNWYTFWSQQIHYKTALGTQGYKYCHTNAWDTPAGANCQTYFQAYSMTTAQENQVWGKKVEEDAAGS